MLAVRSSIILDSSCNPAEVSERALRLSACLEALCSRAQALHDLKGEPQSCFLRLRHEWTNVKAYRRFCLSCRLFRDSFPRSFLCQSDTMLTRTSDETSVQKRMSTVPIGSDLSTSAHLSHPAPSTRNIMSYVDNAFNIDPFNEIFWSGMAENDTAMQLFPA
jgi:hypothetical protein